jgi:hypothetical protein
MWPVSNVNRGYVNTPERINTAALSKVSFEKALLSVNLQANTMKPPNYLVRIIFVNDDIITEHSD